MVNPDVKTSDRFRNIMDIYTAEIEYGNTYEAYKATLPINGNDIEVDMLRIGRVITVMFVKQLKWQQKQLLQNC